jgi:plastocyanin
MTRKIPALLTCLALASGAAFAGCGDDDEETAGTTETTTQAETPAPSGAEGGEVTISMKDVLFTPDNATVKVGQTVKWVNDDPIDHTATAEEGADFDSGNVKPGDTYEFKPTAAGEIAYVCTIHPSQKGTLTVTE